ncbi:hypothetical protein HAZT_HAZT010557 [Hyalella azteca]|uniref:Small ribosomal subunit protein uS7 domain-containing protein n=1 Tax=Hyalella azteca TaxID=294128 RepID=A0A6A0H6A7_HYAAZ|nr:hypothetical protein HAZT_HAZT010557 [Hyalella azteca]
MGHWFPAAPAQFAVRSYAIYSPDKYLEPIYEKEQLEEIFQNKEIKERLQFSQIKPAEQSRSWSFFDHPRVNRLCNYVMKEGNKVLARNLVEETFTRIKRKQLRAYHTAETDEERRNIVCDPLTIYLGAVENCRPFLDLLPIKRGGITYQACRGLRVLPQEPLLLTCPECGVVGRCRYPCRRSTATSSRRGGSCTQGATGLHDACTSLRTWPMSSSMLSMAGVELFNRRMTFTSSARPTERMLTTDNCFTPCPYCAMNL